jgi:isopenicillin N synthase-like dioxygenase
MSSSEIFNIENMKWVDESSAPVPIFDFNDLINNSNNILVEFKKAIINDKFIYLKNHGIEEDSFQNFLNVTHTFFNESDNILKKMVVNNNLHRGITLFEKESTANTVGKDKYSDLCIKYSMGLDNNIFPNKDFEYQWLSYFNKITDISKNLIKLIFQVLNINDKNDKIIKEGDPLIRHLYYPDVPYNRCSDINENEKRMASHNDLDIISLIYQTPSPNGFISLQAKINNNFINVPPVHNTLVVIFGEILHILTNGMVKPTEHRVISPPSYIRENSYRTSTILFFMPNQDLKICPLNSIYNKYYDENKSIKFKDWIINILKDFKNN